MNCSYCAEPIRRTEPRDSIEVHDGFPEYPWVHDNGPDIPGNPICPIPAVADPPLAKGEWTQEFVIEGGAMRCRGCRRPFEWGKWQVTHQDDCSQLPRR